MITFDEVSKTVVDLVVEVRRLSEENKALKEVIVQTGQMQKLNVREPDKKPLAVVKE